MALVEMISMPAVSGKLYNFKIKIADLTVGISCTHELTRRMCAEYLVDEAVSPLIFAEASETDKEKLRKYFLGFSEVFSDDYIESSAIFDKICTQVIAFDAAVFHAALISLDGNGIAFAAPSGTGKTTHIKLWKKIFAERVEIINGDKPLFTLREESFFASGMPWCGKESWNVNKTVPLKNICFVERAEKNKIVPLTDSRDIMSRLFNQLILPADNPDLLIKYLSFANNLINTVPFYLLSCDMSEDAALVAYNGMFGE